MAVKIAVEVEDEGFEVGGILAEHRPHPKAGRAIMRPLVRAGQDIDLHRVDAQPGQVQPADTHIGGRKAKPLAALVAMLHRALDPVPVAKHMGCIARAALGQRGADRG